MTTLRLAAAVRAERRLTAAELTRELDDAEGLQALHLYALLAELDDTDCNLPEDAYDDLEGGAA